MIPPFVLVLPLVFPLQNADTPASERSVEVLVRVLETGANDVLVVEGERERLIPFIADVIAAVDLEAGSMRVNWDADY